MVEPTVISGPALPVGSQSLGFNWRKSSISSVHRSGVLAATGLDRRLSPSTMVDKEMAIFMVVNRCLIDVCSDFRFRNYEKSENRLLVAWASFYSQMSDHGAR